MASSGVLLCGHVKLQAKKLQTDCLDILRDFIDGDSRFVRENSLPPQSFDKENS